MIDFKKRLASRAVEKKINPIDIYDGLDRRSEVGDLREEQKEILLKWWANSRKSKDLIVKLHTGKGKTLIGLLILQSKLNEKKGPCLYICPSKALVKQTCKDAEKFGIPCVQIESDGSLPDEFVSSEKILVTYIQKVFNGKSRFGVKGKYQKVDTIIFDDSHACVDILNDSFKIKVDREHGLYKDLMALFSESLREQGVGSFLEIQSGDSNTFLPVPYWSWIDNLSTITEKILPYASEDDAVKFVWPLIKDDIGNCQCFISGRGLEISTYINPISQFRTFAKAESRIFMSATTQNDSFFVKGLGLSPEAIESPLACDDERWSGEKMILIPSLMHELLDRNSIVGRIAKTKEGRGFGVVCITPSVKRSKLYKAQGAIITNSKSVFDEVNKLKFGKCDQTVVLVNKYDGIDLPDNACRVLVIDSMPYASSLTESYEEACIANSDLISIRNAQKIEQGLGRSVRGERDYSVILIISDDLVKFIKSQESRKYFSEQTRKQIDIGFEIAQISKEEQTSTAAPIDAVNDLIGKVLSRDEGWKEFYRQKMNEIEDGESSSRDVTKKFLNVLSMERKAEFSLYRGDVEKACKLMQQLIDQGFANDLEEKGWYQQILARYLYRTSVIESNKMQKSAFLLNSQLLKPREGINYKKLNYINQNRIEKIKDWIAKFEGYEELSMSLKSILESLTFGQQAERFERALEDLGKALGFLSQRPDKTIKKGPDNLWCAEGDVYFIFECKSEVDLDRTEIHKSETGQMNNHYAWFRAEYGESSNVTSVMIIPTKQVSKLANFSDDVRIMRRGKLLELHKNVTGMFKELREYELATLSDSKIREIIVNYKLDIQSLQNHYSEEYYQKK